jgi:TolB-like protein/Tfp pilus assembly protein PilF
MSLVQELKRRNVFRVAIAYVVTAWLLLQVADVVLSNIEAPAWVFKAFMLAIGIGLPLAILFAWIYELTPDGIRKESSIDRQQSVTGSTARKLDRTIIAVLAIALGYFIIDKVVVDTDAPPQDTSAAVSGPKSLGATTKADPIADRSIAVLPFVNMSSDPEQEFFSDGISEELLNVLAQIRSLRVAARTSSFQFKGDNQDISKIAEQLNVAHVLEGSVRKSGTRLRITAQLIRADTGYHLWSETYDRELEDIFDVQDEIASAIGKALETELGLVDETPQPIPAVMQAANTPAYEAFLRGRRLIHQRGRVSLEEAVAHLERSLRLDANYAPAHAQLAIATILLLESASTYGDLSMEEVNRRAMPHINKAFELAPELPEAYAARALIHSFQGMPQESLADTRKALNLNPSYIDAMLWQRGTFLDLGRFDEAEELLDEILEIDPLSIIGRINLVNIRLLQGDVAAAHDIAASLESQNPWAAYYKHAHASAQDGHIKDSLEWSLRAFAENPNDLGSNFTLVENFGLLSLFDEARRISDALVAFAESSAGNDELAVTIAKQRLSADPDNLTLLLDAATFAYLSADLTQAGDFFEEYLGKLPNIDAMAGSPLALFYIADVRRASGNLEGADEAISLATRTIADFAGRGYDAVWVQAMPAMLDAYHKNGDAAVDRIEAMVANGFRWPQFFRAPIFADIRDRPDFVSAETRALQALEDERAKALDLICTRNPVPDSWQPLPETCNSLQANN